MASKFSFHCQCYKKENLSGIDKHNRRKNKHYGNVDINTERSKFNRIYITPDTSLYQACKKQIEERVLANGGRVTKASNWICECIFSYPEELPADRMDEYYGLILEYLSDKLGKSNVVQAVAHLDEGHLPHIHIDCLLITPDNRLSSKSLITRDFIISVHDELPKILKEHGFDIKGLPSGNHAIRRTYLSNLHEDGIPDDVLVKVAGHKDIATTRKHYLNPTSPLDDYYDVFANALSCHSKITNIKECNPSVTRKNKQKRKRQAG